MSDSIFNGETTPDVVPQPTPEVVLPPEVQELVGEGKKYRSAEEALRAVPHAQKHIHTLEQELAQLREEVSKRRTAEELLDEIKSGITHASEKTSPKAIDSDTITQTVSKVLEQRDAQRTAQVNISKVTSTFTESFGEKAEEMYVKIAEESGMSVPMLNQLAARSPQAVLKLAGLTEKKQAIISKVTSSVNTEGMKPNQGDLPSARVKFGATTKELTDAWKAAGEKVKMQLQST